MLISHSLTNPMKEKFGKNIMPFSTILIHEMIGILYKE